MSILPANISRVPNLMFSQVSLSNLTRTNISLFGLQTQMVTGKAVNKMSDDAVRAASILVLHDRLERSGQQQRNLEHAASSLNMLENALRDAGELALQAKDIASSQLSFGVSAGERASQATVISEMLAGLYNISNRESEAGYVFGGSRSAVPPVVEFHGGYRYVGGGPGLITDQAMGATVPITLGPGNPIGSLSARVRGGVDLNPNLSPDTRLADLAGARGLGVAMGAVRFSFGAGPAAEVELTGADTAGDVADRLTKAIRDYESAEGVTILGSGGVGFSGGGFTFDVMPGPASLAFSEVGSGVTAQDLGLCTGDGSLSFSSTRTAAVDLDPALTWLSPVSTLAGLTGPLGSIRVNNVGKSVTLDLSGAQTLQDIKNTIEGADLGVRVEINADGTGIDVLNEVATTRSGAMSIEEVGGAGLTATRLGIRTLGADTRLDEFNDGRGVQIINGSVNPTTGLADPALDVDFTITLGDSANTRIRVDLRPQDVLTVQTVIDRINQEAAPQLAAAGLPAAALRAGLSDSSNGIVLTQDAGFGAALRVEPNNNSLAAEQLGLMTGRYDTASASLVGEDRAKVRVDNLFTNLLDLREALLGNQTSGIGLAGEGLGVSVERLAETRGLVGGFSKRVTDAGEREQDRAVLDEQLRSQLEDLDYTEAATRFSLLQTQLEAGLRTAATANTLTLLDYLG
ncbi:MAG: hypothetical protein IT436_07940 [Phycisphaerales bacterium]|nr:hypothetical protein [Phycisphaerales bacterium]